MNCGGKTKKMAYGGMAPMSSMQPGVRMAKGGVTPAVPRAANCGASMKPQQKRK